MKQASVKIEKLDDFLGRARKLARLADAGKPIPEIALEVEGRDTPTVDEIEALENL